MHDIFTNVTCCYFSDAQKIFYMVTSTLTQLSFLIKINYFSKLVLYTSFNNIIFTKPFVLALSMRNNNVILA